MARYLIDVRKDMTFRVKATTEDHARAIAIARADGTLPSNQHALAEFLGKDYTITAVEEVS